MKYTVDFVLKKWWYNLNIKYKIVFFTVFISGFLAHGMGFLNKYALHDEITNFSTAGATYTSGRWALYLLSVMVKNFFGTTHFSTPLFNGVVSLFFLAISICYLVKLFKIKSNVFCSLLSALITVFPLFTALFSLYMFTAPYYLIGFFLATLGVYFTCNSKTFTSRFWYSSILALAIGVYQAYIPYIVLLIFLYLHNFVLSFKMKFKVLIIQYIKYFFPIVSALGIYFFVTYLFLCYFNAELTSYSSINSMGYIPFSICLERIKKAFVFFFNPALVERGLAENLFWGHLLFYHFLFLTCAFIFFISLIIRNKNKFRVVVFALFVIFSLPILTNIGFIISPRVHVLMTYGQIGLYIMLFVLFDKTYNMKFNSIILGLSLILIICYCRYANVCYLKNEYTQQRLISYYTTLITRIKSTIDYKDEYPVVFINERKIQDLTVRSIYTFDFLPIALHEDQLPYLNDISWKRFMHIWCAYSPRVGNFNKIQHHREISQMASYPDDGSIKIINKTIIVKF